METGDARGAVDHRRQEHQDARSHQGHGRIPREHQGRTHPGRALMPPARQALGPQTPALEVYPHHHRGQQGRAHDRRPGTRAARRGEQEQEGSQRRRRTHHQAAGGRSTQVRAAHGRTGQEELQERQAQQRQLNRASRLARRAVSAAQPQRPQGAARAQSRTHGQGRGGIHRRGRHVDRQGEHDDHEPAAKHRLRPCAHSKRPVRRQVEGRQAQGARAGTGTCEQRVVLQCALQCSAFPCCGRRRSDLGRRQTTARTRHTGRRQARPGGASVRHLPGRACLPRARGRYSAR